MSWRGRPCSSRMRTACAGRWSGGPWSEGTPLELLREMVAVHPVARHHMTDNCGLHFFNQNTEHVLILPEYWCGHSSCNSGAACAAIDWSLQLMKASTIGGTKLWSLRFPTLISEGKLKFGVLISEDFLNGEHFSFVSLVLIYTSRCNSSYCTAWIALSL